MSINEAIVRIVCLAILSGVICYAYGVWYFRFSLSQATQLSYAKRLLLFLLAIPVPAVMMGSFFVIVIDKPFFKLICETGILFYGTVTIIVLSCTPGFLKLIAANDIRRDRDESKRKISKRSAYVASVSLYGIVVLHVWTTHKSLRMPEVVIMMIIAVAFTVFRFIVMPRLIARSRVKNDATAINILATNALIVVWLMVAYGIYRAI